MQARVGGKYLSLHETFRMVFESRERRWSHLYKGVGSNFMRAILAWGITNSSYEVIIVALKRGGGAHVTSTDIAVSPSHHKSIVDELSTYDHDGPFDNNDDEETTPPPNNKTTNIKTNKSPPIWSRVILFLFFFLNHPSYFLVLLLKIAKKKNNIIISSKQLLKKKSNLIFSYRLPNKL